MTPNTSAVRKYFAKLSLEPEIADIYLALHAHGPQSISALSRSSGVERTRIYRLIPDLLDSGLIEVESRTKRGILKPAPITNLNILISKREQELTALQDELQLIEQVLSRNSLSSPASRVQFYHGPEGAKQMLWNETKAGTEIAGILYEPVQLNTKDKFFERWAAACNERDLHFRGIVGDRFLANRPASASTTTRLAHFTGRYISPSIFPVTHSMFIYDDVVAYYNWQNNEIFGIELYNKDIAAAQRRLFELLWAQAAPLPLAKDDLPSA
ncbi:MAG TPA: helix-turn-helix domain-containing protein [Candidatus Saccharimonadales bacterium]|nr:helix-turn-helix domain-containing protein [Candidatus Saccharimonadales bacterium]